MRPFGYEIDRFTIREQEAAFLREAAQRVLDGESLRSVTQALNQAGARTSGGNVFQPTVLRRILISPRIAARETMRDGSTRKADWPPIVDLKTHRRLVKLLTDTGRTRGGSPGPRIYLLTGGVAHCGLCGKPLIARPNSDKTRSYVCSSGEPYFGCGRIRINADPFENHIVESVLQRLARKDGQKILAAAQAAVGSGADSAKAFIAEAETRTKQLAEDYAEGVLTRDEFVAARDRLAEKTRLARNALRLGEAMQAGKTMSAEDLLEWWEHSNLESQRRYVETLVDRIEVFPAVVKGSKFFDPARIKITWRRS